MVQPSVKIEVYGIENVQKYLEKNEDAAHKAVADAMNQVGLYMEKEVKSSIAGERAEHTSVDTGHLMQSVTADSDEGGAVVYTDVEYGKFIEYGTTRMAPRSHFRNSLARNKSKINQFVQDAIKKNVK